ncbi:MAG: type III pantothenate kinase [Phycisphaerales bacterium]|nr:type III pantothenate kinase [Phycisphaerales bacterium]
MNTLQLVAISVGNTRTHIAAATGTVLADPKSMSNIDLGAIIQAILAARESLNPDSPRPILIASNNDTLADQLGSALTDQLSESMYRVGDDLPIPIQVDLAPETITGSDRLLNAVAAFDVLQQACVVVDAGTAVTVDFIDGKGTFHGGAIAPGARMQLAALHKHTDALPDVDLAAPDTEVFGRSTAEAMLRGVNLGIRGLVRTTVEQYAEHYGAFPTIIATGGDADLLFRGDEFVDRVVPDLTLLGIALAGREAMATASDDGDTA